MDGQFVITVTNGQTNVAAPLDDIPRCLALLSVGLQALATYVAGQQADRPPILLARGTLPPRTPGGSGS